MALTVADLNRLMEQVKTDKVRAASTGSSDKLSYIIYNEDGTPNYRNTLIAALATTAGLSELNKLRILALYDTSEAGGYDNLIQQINDLNNTVSDLKTKLNTLEAQIDDVGDVNDKIDTITTSLSELQSLYNGINSKVTSLNESVDANENTINTVVENVNTLQDLTNSLKQQIADIIKDIEELKKLVANLDLDTVNNKITDIESDYAALSKSVSDLSKRVDGLEEGGDTPSTGGLEDRVKTLEDTIKTINNKLATYDETIQQIDYNITQAVQTASNAQSAVNNLSNTVSTHTDTISTLQSNIRTINSDIANIKEQLSSITPGGDIDLSDYVTETEMLNQITSLVTSLRGATIYNLHVIGWHNDAGTNYDSETYPDASNSNEYFEQYGMIAAKEITSKSQLLGLTANASTVATWITNIMYADSLEDVWKMMEAHSILSSLGYGKPKALYSGFDGTTITIDSYWGFDKGCIIRCKISGSGVSFEELIDFGTVSSNISSSLSRISSLESRVSALE